MPPRPVDFDPEKPLHNERHEHFARMRAVLTPRLQAAREAGYDEMTPGNAAKLDRRADIRARIAALSKMDEEIIRMKRERIEARLMKAMEGDILRDFAIVETVVVDGVETSKVVGVGWDKLRQSDSSVIISEFVFDSDTGHLTRFKRDDAMNAAAQLRDMLGFKAPTKVATTNAASDGPAEVKISVLSGVPRAPDDPTSRAPSNSQPGDANASPEPLNRRAGGTGKAPPQLREYDL